MMTAAAASSFWVLRIRPTGCSSSSPGPPSTWVATATPVSNPERPSASLGKTSSAIATMASGLPCSSVRVARQSPITCGCSTTCQTPAPTTTRLSARYTTTRATATPIASVNPRRKTIPRSATSPMVMASSWPCRTAGTCGFSTTWAAASAAESVMVMMKSVQAKPRSTSTKSLPRQNGSSRSSMAIDPWPCGLSAATRR